MGISLGDLNLVSGGAVSVIPTAAARSLLLVYIYLGEMVFCKKVSTRESINMFGSNQYISTTRLDRPRQVFQ